MKTIFADFNSMTNDDHICLTTRGSQEDLRKSDVHVGDWVWLDEGELIVGARVAEDPYWGLIGIPAWKTLVPLDEEGADDPAKILSELEPLLQHSNSARDEARTIQLITQLERVSPSHFAANSRPGYLQFKRAVALLTLDCPHLALPDIEDARRLAPDKPTIRFIYLEILRRTAPDRAFVEAMNLTSSKETTAMELVAAINVLAARAEELPDDEFEPIARRALQACERFDRASGRSDVAASLLSVVHFNRGLLLLRLGEDAEARRALELAHLINPLDQSLNEATRLVTYDQHAREIGSRVRSQPLAA